LNESCLHGIPFNVTATLKVIAFFGDTGASESFLEKMADETILLLKISSITELHLMHEAGKVIPPGNLKEQVVVIRHQAVVIEEDLVFGLGLEKFLKKRLEVFSFLKEVPAVIAPVEKVVNGFIDELPGFSWHASPSFG